MKTQQQEQVTSAKMSAAYLKCEWIRDCAVWENGMLLQSQSSN